MFLADGILNRLTTFVLLEERRAFYFVNVKCLIFRYQRKDTTEINKPDTRLLMEIEKWVKQKKVDTQYKETNVQCSSVEKRGLPKVSSQHYQMTLQGQIR